MATEMGTGLGTGALLLGAVPTGGEGDDVLSLKIVQAVQDAFGPPADRGPFLFIHVIE